MCNNKFKLLLEIRVTTYYSVKHLHVFKIQ